MREQIFLNQGAVTVEVHNQLRNDLKQQKNQKGYKKPPFNPRNSNNNRNEHNDRKQNTCFRCGSDDRFIANCLKTDTLDNKVHWNNKNPKNRAYRLTKIDKKSETSTYKIKSQNIYVSMAHMYSNS